MKNVIVILCLLIYSLAAHAQVTIGSNAVPDKNAVLDLISNANKGLLLPRVALSATNLFSPLTAHVAGMTVYNTATAGTGVNAVKPGVYFNDGTKWICLADYAQMDKTDDAFVNDSTTTAVKLKTTSNGNSARAVGAEFVIKDNGNTGIGTALPVQKLDVNGAIKFSGALMPNNTAGTSGQVLTSAGAGTAPLWTSLISSNTPNIYTADGTLTGNRIVTQSIYNLGFNSSATTGTSHFTIDGTTFNVDAINNRIGLGTATPLSKLHLEGENTPTLTLRGNGIYNTSTYPQGRISFLESGSTTYGFNINLESPPTGNYNSLRIQANEGGTLTDILTVEASGKTGLNATSPSETLDVNGTARVRSLENANTGQTNCANYTRKVVADTNGKLGYVNRTSTTMASYSSKISDIPVTTTYTTADYYPVLIGMSFQSYSSSGGFSVIWDNSGTYWKYDFLAQYNNSETCSIQVIWVAK